MNWINSFLKNNYSNYKCVRKYIGGYWECWYIDVIHCDLWFKIQYEQIDGYRPGCGHGTPYCEYYPISFFGYKLDYIENLQNIIRKEKLKRVLNIEN